MLNIFPDLRNLWFTQAADSIPKDQKGNGIKKVSNAFWQ